MEFSLSQKFPVSKFISHKILFVKYSVYAKLEYSIKNIK